MKLTIKDTNLAVVDDVLEPQAFKDFWNYFNNLDFAYRSMTGWQKIWRISDGQILAGAGMSKSQAPFNNPMDIVLGSIIGLTTEYLSDIVGKEGEDWNEIVLSPYIYPAGTKISWHDDADYSGAAIFYPHPEWNPYWGGELFVAKTPNPDTVEGLNDMENQINRNGSTKLLNHFGMGVYVSPLPNRIVFTKGKTWHCINRVDASAGDKVRCSIVAFFVKNKVESYLGT